MTPETLTEAQIRHARSNSWIDRTMTTGGTGEVTGETITDAQIHLVRKAMQGVPRKISYHRAIIADCGPALDNNKACRESVASAYNKMSRGLVRGVPTP